MPQTIRKHSAPSTAAGEAGLRVPEDISIIGAGNIESIYHPNPFLSTIDWPRQQLGEVAANMLLDAIRDGDSAKVASRVFTPKWLRASRPPPSQNNFYFKVLSVRRTLKYYVRVVENFYLAHVDALAIFAGVILGELYAASGHVFPIPRASVAALQLVLPMLHQVSGRRDVCVIAIPWCQSDMIEGKLHNVVLFAVRLLLAGVL